MAYLTRAEALQAARAQLITLDNASGQLRKSAGSSPATTFDIFLSHSYEDALMIAGVKELLRRDGFSVYVDWQDDSSLDRSAVTPANAAALRNRLDHCRFLIYAAPKASADSRWMPWELGYFDGKRTSRRVAILPIVASSGTLFHGLEYLGLYQVLERIDFVGRGLRFGRHIGRSVTGARTGETLETMTESRT